MTGVSPGRAGRRGNNEGTIFHRADGRWAAALSDGYTAAGRPRRAYVYGRTRAEVAGKLQELQQRRVEGRPLVDRQTRLGDFLEEWIAETLPHTVRRSTAISYADQLRRHVVPVLGRRPLAKLTAAEIQRWQTSRLDLGLSPRTVQYQHAILRRALAQAERWGLVGRNVATLVQAPRPRHIEVQPLSVEDARTLLAAARDDRLYALWAVALGVGLRKGEALGLRWRDVDLDVGTLRVAQTVQRVGGELIVSEPKTPRSRRTVPLPPIAIAALRAHRVQQSEERLLVGSAWSDTDLVFTTPIGTAVDPRNLSRQFAQLCDRAGVRRVRVHDLRHTCASLLLAQGVEPRVIMETLGHSQIATTMNTYAHVLPVLQRHAADLMHDLLTGARA